MIVLRNVLSARRGLAGLRGKVVLITGGSRGLGLLLAREFARQGCRVALCARHRDQLERAREDLAARGADVWIGTCDVSNADEVQRLVAELSAKFGRVDLLVNNAGIIQVGPASCMTADDYELAMNTIFWGSLNMILAVLPQMQARREGQIVNITSIGGKVSVPHLLPYCCAKFALVALSEGLRAELARKGIRVTTVVPGLMRTGSHVNAMFKGRQGEESAWFELSASLPVVSMDAERAARAIVRAARRRDAELTLSLPAIALARFHGLFPAPVASVLSLVNCLLLPKDEGGATVSRQGKDAPRSERPLIFQVLTQLGRVAAQRYNQT
ncbi:MAG: SDR family NAD(P)-dependent oxidoreductase [Terriglobia bacterium]